MDDAVVAAPHCRLIGEGSTSFFMAAVLPADYRTGPGTKLPVESI